MASASVTAAVEQAYHEHERLLWGLCYRMTGCAADADDLVHETYARALERPPRRLDLPLRPWLARVAINLARDHLRRRRRTTYTGPWLPSPVEDATDDSAVVPSSECRYELRESATLAFLRALEALTPQQRAVLLLRDVYEYSVRETARTLELSEANVKTTLHRAHRAMRDYDASPCRPDAELHQKYSGLVERFTACLREGDAGGLAAMMCEDVQLISDGGGEFLAALQPLQGRDNVMRFFSRTWPEQPPAIDTRELNGLPAVLWEFDEPPAPRTARRYVVSCELAPDGRVAVIHAVVASRKLSAVRFAESG